MVKQSRFLGFRRKDKGGNGLIQRVKGYTISKRQRYVLVVFLLSLGFFLSEYFLGKSGVYLSLLLAFVAVIFTLWSNYQDIRDNFSPAVFILPFFFSLSFGLFYFLAPSRMITRIAFTSLYALGLYSLMLAQNIFIVSTIHTIALLASARTVAFLLTILSYFFLSNIVYSMHDLPVIAISFLVFIYSFFLVTYSVWTYTLEKSLTRNLLWSVMLSVSLTELSLILWFLPSNPTVLGLFLTCFFYIMMGLSHVWFDKRLFRGVLWEYGWVGVIAFCILVVFTAWPS